MANSIVPKWESLGFANEPKEAQAKGIEHIFRCYSSTPKKKVEIEGEVLGQVGSFLFGNCFFVPKVGGSSSIQNATNIDRRKKWTAPYLESQLNAWFWDNDFERIAMFQLSPGVSYLIGPVGQDTLAASPYTSRSTGLRHTHQRHLAWPSLELELLQVVLLLSSRSVQSVATLLDDWKVPGSLGRLSRA